MKKVAISIHANNNFSPKIIEGLQGFDFIHIDVMDGLFVNNLNKNLNVFRVLKKKYRKLIIAHLMVNNPLEYFEQIFKFIDIFVFHIESEGDIERIIEEVKNKNKKVGIALNPDTQISEILPFLNKIDLVLIMSVHPGWSGQKFIREVLDKISFLLAFRQKNKLDFLIDIDGGVNLENAKFINSDILSSASAILKAKDPNFIIQSLKHAYEHTKVK
ncbi:hypothetical protein LCGC14_0807460 [marine sediment metagenome]|uniref:Ribulose-phosphate 3-epimerase n=1 Tax=marine sediment metagenome TaxID=412755 RepID=A0A0F9PMP1_9ZZZZ